MFLFSTINSNCNTKMIFVLQNELLHFITTIIQSICCESKHIVIKPMMIQCKHLYFEIITNLVYQVYFQAGLATNKLPINSFFWSVFFVRQNIINCFFGNIKSHSFFSVLTYKIAIFTT